jgi:adenylate cyclase class IV
MARGYKGSIFSEEEINVFIERTIQHQKDNPSATRAGLARLQHNSTKKIRKRRSINTTETFNS